MALKEQETWPPQTCFGKDSGLLLMGQAWNCGAGALHGTEGLLTPEGLSHHVG